MQGRLVVSGPVEATCLRRTTPDVVLRTALHAASSNRILETNGFMINRTFPISDISHLIFAWQHRRAVRAPE
jgi:hypothetical protein